MTPQAHTGEAKRIADQLAADMPRTTAGLAACTAEEVARFQLAATVGVLHATLGATR